MQETQETCSVPFNNTLYLLPWASLVAQMVKSRSANARDPGSIPGSEDSLEKEMATHSSILAWKIGWTEESGRLQSMGSQGVGHYWARMRARMLYLVNKKEYLGTCSRFSTSNLSCLAQDTYWVTQEKSGSESGKPVTVPSLYSRPHSPSPPPHQKCHWIFKKYFLEYNCFTMLC